MNFPEELLYQMNHSVISSYPINYYSFPLAENCKLIEINLNENEYLFIPKKWMHWVFTEPYNISMNYFIKKYNVNNNPVIDNLKKNQPFKGKIDNIKNNYFTDFFKKNLDNKFFFGFSTTSHVAPVIKPNLKNNSFAKFITIRESISSKYKDYYKYIAQFSDYNDPYLNNLSNFIDNMEYIEYTPGLWINLDKSIDSGLHHDGADNILINFIGKKKILLGHPDDIKYMYIQKLPRIEYRK
jgi:hypothetical protein